MKGRLFSVALFALLVALVVPGASSTRPPDATTTHHRAAPTFFLACPPACIDLDVSQGDTPDPVPAGNQLTYHIVLQNHGPNAATDVTLIDTLAPGTTCVSVTTNVDPNPPTGPASCSPPGGACNIDGSTIFCFFQEIENTDTSVPPAVGPRQITVVVRPDPTDQPPTYPRTITNTVSVDSDSNTEDRNPDNNRSLEDTQVTSPGDLKLTKTHTGIQTETRTVTAVGTAGAGGTGVTFSQPLDFAHDNGLPVIAHSTTGVAGTTLAAAAPATAVNIKVASVTGVTVGQPIEIDTDPVPPATVMTYELRIDNTGDAATLFPQSDSHPQNPENPITATDTLPHGFEFSGTADPENTGVDDRCTATEAGPLENSIVTCHPQTSIPGRIDPLTGLQVPPSHYTIYLQATPVQTGSFTNLATVTKDGGDANTTDNSASDPTRVACPKPSTRRAFQLCVTKSDSQDPVPEGKTFTYSINVINERTGPEDEVDDPVNVQDTLPPGMTVVGTAGASCVLPVTNGVLSCTVQPPIAPGKTKTITVSVIALQIGTFENVACILFQERKVCANEPTTIIGAADLMITKTGSPNPVEVNSDLTYTIKVTNKGPADVPNVQMDDSIPENVDFISSAVSPGTADCALTTPTSFHCNLGLMAATTSKTITIVVKPTQPGVLTNTATVANDGSPQAPVDFDLTNNTATFTANALAVDLAITKVAAPTTVGIGQPLTFTLTVTNKGPGVAANVVLTDPLPKTVSSPTTTTTKGTCSGTATITCPIGTMAVAEVVTITIQVTPNSPGTLTNTASVDSDSFDTDKSNNQATATAKITAADVAISKAAGPDPVAVGTSLTYTLTVSNKGPNQATGVTVRDTLPDAVALPTSTPSQGTCFGSPTVTCDLGDLGVNVTATVTIVVTPIVASGSITNTASVSSAFDTNSANNSASVTTRVIDPRLVVSPDLATPGFVPFATGTDFPPNAPVELTWQTGLGTKTVTAAPDGTFTVPMLVFPNDEIGPRLLVATALQPESPATAFLPTSTDFLVLPATSQPFQVQPQVPITKLVQRSG